MFFHVVDATLSYIFRDLNEQCTFYTQAHSIVINNEKAHKVFESCKNTKSSLINSGIYCE